LERKINTGLLHIPNELTGLYLIQNKLLNIKTQPLDSVHLASGFANGKIVKK
jgi:hypothetical protein